MTLDKSLKVRAGAIKSRNVMTRAERVKRLQDLDKWSDNSIVLGMAKVRVPKISLKKKKKVKKEDEADDKKKKKKESLRDHVPMQLCIQKSGPFGPLFLLVAPRGRTGTAQGNALGSMVTRSSQALKGRDDGCAAPSGLDEMTTRSQGVALGYRIAPRCG